MDDTAAAGSAQADFASEQPRPRRKSPRDTFAQVRAKERVRVAEFSERYAARLETAWTGGEAGFAVTAIRGLAGSVRADLCDPEAGWPQADAELPL